MTTEKTQALVDTLPPGAYYVDREDEADLIEYLRQGYLAVSVMEPMTSFLDLLTARVGHVPTMPDWAAFRYYLQGQCALYLSALCMADFVPPTPGIIGGDVETPDVEALLRSITDDGLDYDDETDVQPEEQEGNL